MQWIAEWEIKVDGGKDRGMTIVVLMKWGSEWKVEPEKNNGEMIVDWMEWIKAGEKGRDAASVPPLDMTTGWKVRTKKGSAKTVARLSVKERKSEGREIALENGGPRDSAGTGLRKSGDHAARGRATKADVTETIVIDTATETGKARGTEIANE